MTTETLAVQKLDPEFAHEIEMVAPTPMQLIQQVLAVGGNATEMATVIKELVALQQSQERFAWEREERQAKIQFDEAMNRCQKQIGRIAPNQKRNDTSSWWADYAQLDRTVRPIYTGEGFSICFREVPSLAPGKVRIEGEVSRGGVSKTYHAEITPTTTGPKGGAMATATDADAIAQSRAKRYIMLDIFNIAVGIDKEEKTAIQTKPEDVMDESVIADFVALIEGSGDVDELKRNYFTATKAGAADPSALRAFDAAKKETWKRRGFKA